MRNKQERLNGIINKLRVEEQVSLEDLASAFQVSTATIRRDVKLLIESGQVMHTVGGMVVYRRDFQGPSSEDLLYTAINEKVRIAERCTMLVEKQQTILLGPGVITKLTGKILGGLEVDFRLVTSSVSLARELSSVPNIRTVLVGGEVTGDWTNAFNTAEYFTNIIPYADLLFLTADGIDAEYGLTYFSSDMQALLRGMVSVAQKVILIADSSRFGKVCFNKFDEIDIVDVIITDNNLKKSTINLIKRKGISLIMV